MEVRVGLLLVKVDNDKNAAPSGTATIPSPLIAVDHQGAGSVLV